jgi:TonB family protein
LPAAGGGDAAMTCNADPACTRYLEQIRQRVYTRWNPDRNIPIGKVRMGFRIDEFGTVRGIRIRESDNPALGESCLAAFQQASPFPIPPAQIAYVLNKNLTATFELADKREPRIGAECRGYNLETDAAVTGTCVEGTFEGVNSRTRSRVTGTCVPGGNLDAQDVQSRQRAAGTCAGSD